MTSFDPLQHVAVTGPYLGKTGFLNDGSSDSPKLRVYLNLDTLQGLQHDSAFPATLLSTPMARDIRLAEQGFEGVQLTAASPAQPAAGLPFCGTGRLDHPADADALVARHANRGDNCLTLHVGTGLEDDAAADRLVEAMLLASVKYRLPVFLETHRATLTQDLWRTVQIAYRFPEVRFNGDFSHYYCGQEMAYGDWDAKLAFMAPIFARTGFMHGRVASPGCMQVPLYEPGAGRSSQVHGFANYLTHFRDIWMAALRGFLRHAQRGDVLVFAPELLSGDYYYARLFPDALGHLVEECDRYAQALLLKSFIRDIFCEASFGACGQPPNDAPDLGNTSMTRNNF